MDLSTFFNKFDQFAEAPDAVARMRELVLQLAVQGRLVSQSPNDEPADALAVTIAEDRAAFVKKRSLARQRVFAPVEDDQCSFAVPSGWVWTRVGNLCRVQAGFAFESAAFVQGDSGVPMIRIRDITKDHTQVNYVGEYREEFLVDAGDYLVGMDGNFTVAKWRGPRALLNQRVARLQWYSQHLEPSFFAIATQYRLSELQGTKAYTTVDHLSSGQIENAAVPLPPLAEQKRIVAKLGELMELCDRLEAQQQEGELRHAALARASLARFAEASTPANLPFLFHPSYAIPPADLRKSILTLAVQGKLVPQDPNDEPAEEGIRRVPPQPRPARYDKRSSANIQGIAALSVGPTERDIPTGWSCVPLIQIARLESGHTPSRSRPDWWGGDVSWVGVVDARLHNGRTIFETLQHTNEKGLANSAARMLPAGTVCVSRTASVGYVTILGKPMATSQDFVNWVPSEAVTSDWLQLVFTSEKDAFNRFSKGAVHQTIYYPEWLSMHTMLPPLAEQRRIVVKVEQLMALVDALETQLAASRAIAANLLSALVAELTGTEEISNRAASAKGTVTMKAKADVSTERREPLEPLKSSTKSFVLRRFAMSSGYRSLDEFDCTYHSEEAAAEEASPIVLVGLNGSGKSNLIEAAAEVFCFLELINLPWKKVASSSSRYRANRHLFELEYTLEDDHEKSLVRVRKTKKSNAEFYTVSEDGTETPVEAGRAQLRLLPRRIIGYSSGLNETVSHPFLRTKTIYSEEVRDAAPPEGKEASEGTVFDTRTLYMDYESNAAILISNYIFQKSADLAIIKEFTRVTGVSSFGLRFNRKRAGKSGPNSVVRLTTELKRYLQSFALCAGVKYDDQQIAYELRFELTPETTELFRREFGTAETLFMAMHKWSLLNALILSDEQRKVYLSSDITRGALERPPSVPPSDRVFDIFDLTLRLTEPPVEIDYSGLSDGEHQFIQVFGTALLFSAPGTLFLFDEPESHFNPEWRTKFNLTLNRLPNASRQEYMISTHSPFVVSGSRQGNVYKFTRTGGQITCKPVEFETYGASFDDLLKKLFSITSLIDESAREELEEIIEEGDLATMQDAVGDFAESKEKRRLYEAIIAKEG